MIRRLTAAAALLAAGLSWATPDRVQACVIASEAGQLAQRRGALFEARRAFEQCSDAACPGVVRTECTRWLEQVLAATPSIVVVVRIAGSDQPPDRVLLDGQPAPAPVTGRPWDVDPGEHLVTVEVGDRSAQQRLVANTGEKNRLVVFDLPPPAPTSVAVAAPARARPLVPLILSGVAVVGGSLFAGLGLSGRARLDALKTNECATTKTCSPTAVADVQRRFVAADVSLAVAIVGALTAAWQWWHWADGTPATALLAPNPGGASVAVVGRF